jgi:hypothetical protein
VRPFRCRFADAYLRRDQVIKPLDRYQTPKLLVVKSTGILQAALDEQGYVAVQTLYLLHPRPAQCSSGFLLALLNARLLRGYLWLHHTAYKLVQPQIEQEALAHVPIPLAAPAQQAELAALADQLRRRYEERDGLANAFANGANAITTVGACENRAAWIQLEQTITDLCARLDASIAALCGLTAAEKALLERIGGCYTTPGREQWRLNIDGRRT